MADWAYMRARWRSGMSTRLPPIDTNVDRDQILLLTPVWVEFVVGSLPCSERFISGYSGSQPRLPNSNSIWNARTRFTEFL